MGHGKPPEISPQQQVLRAVSRRVVNPHLTLGCNSQGQPVVRDGSDWLPARHGGCGVCVNEQTVFPLAPAVETGVGSRNKTLSEDDRQRPECDLRTIEALASTLDVAILVFDRNDTILVASSGLCRLFNVPPELLLPGARLRDLLGAMYEAGAGVMGSLNGKPRNIAREDWIAERIALHWRERSESVEKLSDGRWMRLRKRRLPDGLLISVIEDVTDQKRKEADLALIQQKAELSQIVLDDLPYPVIVKDAQLRYVIVNKAFCTIPGLKPYQVVGLTAWNLVEPKLAAEYEKIERQVLETGIPYQARNEIFRPDGTAVRVVTRVHRSGVPGNYFITILLEDDADVADATTGEFAFRLAHDAPIVPAPERCERSGSSAGQSRAQRRVLVLEENSQRSDARVAALKQAGIDAVSVTSPAEAIAFLDAANAMNLVVDDVEISAQHASAFDGEILPAQHGVLKLAIDRQRAARAANPVRSDPPAAKPQFKVSPQSSVKQAQCLEAAKPKSPDSVTGAVSPPRKRVRVLVAEDNDVNQIVFEQILEGIGVDFRIVTNGQEAVAAWQAATPDIILMDISMPVMNGLQAAQAIRDSETAAGDAKVHVPIIAVTAHAMSGDRERCFAAGMDDYLSKPVSPEKLEAMIQRWLDPPTGCELPVGLSR